MAKTRNVKIVRRDATSSPGCLLPALAGGSAKKTQRKKRSTTPVRQKRSTSSVTSSDPLAKETAGGTTDYSAWEAFQEKPVFPNEKAAKQPMTPSTTATSTAGGVEQHQTANFSVGGESSTQPLSYSTASQRTPASSERSVQNLLTLPTPTDRSNRRRLKYEQEKRQKGLYEGELEPVGTRGQEASLKKISRLDGSTAGGSNQDAPQIRSFDATPPLARDRKNFAGKEIALVLPAGKGDTSNASLTNTRPPANGIHANKINTHQQSKANPSTKKRAIAAPDDSSSETSSRREMLPPVQLHTGTGKAVRGTRVLDPNSYVPSAYQPRGNSEDDDDDDDSTQSDEDLQRLRADLMPSFSADYEANRPAQDARSAVSDGPRLSPAAAAAARAAAATLQKGPDSLTLVEVYNKQAMDAVQDGRLNDAVDLFNRVLSLQKSQHGEIHPSVASAYHNLGTVQAKRAAALSEDAVAQQLCRTAALEAFQAAARTARDSLGSTHPNVAVSLVRIGFLLLHSKQYHNALITFAEALRIRLAAFGKNHALTANLYNNLGVCHMHLEEFDQGRRALHTGMAIQRKLCAESDAKAKTNGTVPWLELADTLFNIGGLCMEWIRKKGPDLRHARESEDAFAEAYEVRCQTIR